VHVELRWTADAGGDSAGSNVPSSHRLDIITHARPLAQTKQRSNEVCSRYIVEVICGAGSGDTLGLLGDKIGRHLACRRRMFLLTADFKASRAGPEATSDLLDETRRK